MISKTKYHQLVVQLRKDCDYYERMMYKCSNEDRAVDEAHHAGRLKQAKDTLEFLGENV